MTRERFPEVGHDAIVPSGSRGAATRNRLVAAATELIGEVGWGAVSTRMVAARAGVPNGSVHYHFGTVDSLLRAAAVETLRALTTELGAHLEGVPLAQGVENLAAAVAAQAQSPAGNVLVGEISLRATRDDSLRRDVAAALDGLRRELVRWLVDHGHTHVEATATATVLAAAIDALAMHRALDPGLSLTGVTAALQRLVGGAAS